MIRDSFYIKAIRFIEDNLNIPLAPTLHNIALYFSEKRKNKLAKFFLTPALRAYPDDYDYLSLMFNIYHDLGMEEESYQVTQKLLAMNPEDAIVHYNLAIDEARYGNKDKAIEHYKKALEIDPNYKDALNNYGNILKTIDIPKAIELITKAYTLDSSDRKVALNLADCYGRIKNYCEAEKLYKKLLTAYPDDRDTIGDYIIMLYNKDDIDEALNMAKAYQTKYPQYHRPYFYLAYIDWTLGEISQAENNFKKAIELGSPDAKKELDRMLKEVEEDDVEV
jgi:tetratricopeptide (TPR) repeat protein